MTTFVRLLEDEDKATRLQKAAETVRRGGDDCRVFNVLPSSFRDVPGAPFAYWVDDAVRRLFKKFPTFESDNRTCRMGMATANDLRFVRIWWEPLHDQAVPSWFPMAKGGGFSPFYSDLPLVVKWTTDDPPGRELKAFAETTPGTTHWSRNLRNVDYYFMPGLTWPLRTHRFCPQVLPADSIISVRGSGIYVDSPEVFLGLLSSSTVDYLMKMVSGRDAHPQFDGGDISLLPIPEIESDVQQTLGLWARRAWSLKRSLDTTMETSHAFLLPAALIGRVTHHNPALVETELAQIQGEIDELALKLFGLKGTDLWTLHGAGEADEFPSAQDEDEDAIESNSSDAEAFLSWSVGVAFGRFDWRLATGEREAPPEPQPFDPLPARSPGMLQDGAEVFHGHDGILADDPGHPHDVVRIVEEVLERVGMPVPHDVRRWLQRDFFPFHLQRYSKSRRKAPIYWPLSTPSGSYTLWIYYPSLNSQTFYTAVNDFVEPKLKQLRSEITVLLNRGANRSRDDEKQFERIQAIEQELVELRDLLLKIAQDYRPDHDDGVQITAAPLWPLFRHKPWQKVLKDTWTRLEKGDYDWAHLAMSYWPDRVREKCKTDKSFAIAHGAEAIYVEPIQKGAKSQGTKFRSKQ